MIPAPPPARSIEEIMAIAASGLQEPPAGSLGPPNSANSPITTITPTATVNTNSMTSNIPNIEEIIRVITEKYPATLQELKDIQRHQFETFAKKNTDYGLNNIMMGGNIDDPDDRMMALRGIAFRMNDKMERIKTLVLKGKTLQNESVEDSFLDISVYAMIALIVTRQKWGK